MTRNAMAGIIFRPEDMAYPEPKCKLCGRPACFGYGVRILKGELGTWYCGLHNPQPHRQCIVDDLLSGLDV